MKIEFESLFVCNALFSFAILSVQRFRLPFLCLYHARFSASAFIECKFYAHSHRYFICSSITLIICVISCPPKGKKIMGSNYMHACMHTYIIGNFSSSSTTAAAAATATIYRFFNSTQYTTQDTYTDELVNIFSSPNQQQQLIAAIIMIIHKKMSKRTNERTRELPKTTNCCTLYALALAEFQNSKSFIIKYE